MNVRLLFDQQKAEIARQVTKAAEQFEVSANRRETLCAFATTMQIRANGSITLRQFRNEITLAPSQAAELVNRVAIMQLREQARKVLS